MRYCTSSIIVITRSILFSLKCTRNRLAAGLRLDPLVELECSPRSLAVLGGGMGPPGGVGEGGRERRGGEGRGREEEEEKWKLPFSPLSR